MNQPHQRLVQQKHTRPSSGFTLIEILIALAVFAILATLTSSVLYNAFNTRARVAEQSERVTALQLAISMLARDTIQILNRPVRENNMQLSSSFIGQSNYTEFTRGGIGNPNSEETRSTLSRIGLLCRNHQLIRRTWLTLDPVRKEEYEDRVLLKDLTHCQFSYLNKTLQVLNVWHEEAGVVQQIEPLPKAIRLDITMERMGNMNYLLPIPKAQYAY